MKKNTLFLFILIIISISIQTIIITINYGDKCEIFTKIEKIEISSPIIRNKDQFLTIDFNESTSYLSEPGKPMLPVITKVYNFPLGTNILDINIEYDNSVYLLEKEIIPSPNPCLLNLNEKRDNDSLIYINNSYNSSVLYPKKSIFIKTGAGLKDNKRIISITVAVVPQYNPILNTLYVPKSVNITFRTLPSEEPLSTLFNDYEMLVITPDIFTDTLQPLIEYKNEIGVKTFLKTTEEIYDEYDGYDKPEKIKMCIMDSIEEYGILYVLLIGNSNYLPVRDSHVYVDYFKHSDLFTSDLYYADIYNADGDFCSWDSNNNNIFGEFDWGNNHSYDTIDLYPDVFLGRLACNNNIELENCINKIICYESNRSYSKNWFNNITSIGGDTFTDDKIYNINEGEYVNQQVIDILEGHITEKIWVSNNKLNSENPTGVEIINSVINRGCGFIDFSGHGHPFFWATHPNKDEKTWLPTPNGAYVYVEVNQLINKEKLPIIVIGACSTCKFKNNDNSFGWSFLSNPNGGGIGVFGVTTWGYAEGGGKTITERLIEKMKINTFEIFQEYNIQGKSLTFGELWNEAINQYIMPNMDSRDYRTIESWQSFGDPSLLISYESNPPEKPFKPNGSIKIEPNINYSYYSKTNDIDNDKIYYLFDWGDGNNSGWIGPYESNIIINVTHQWTKIGIYNIRIKAKDENGVQSEWSKPLSIRLDRKKITNFNISSDIKLKKNIPNFITQKIKKKIIYVDDDNIFGPWNGSQEYPYNKIQNAIDNANIFDTIFVYNGFYHENLYINKTINLIGENKNITYIDSERHLKAIEIFVSERITITGFTIQHGEVGIELINSNHTNIYNNRIWDNNIGICIKFNGKYNNIRQNDLRRNNLGISIYYIQNDNHNTVNYNNFINNGKNARPYGIKCNWDNNFWDDWIGLKFSFIDFLPYLVYFYPLNFDMNPAKTENLFMVVL